ncbi:hypothetical protein [Tissierella praeacuta]|uniref:hypothetical protein n=1 Tax=Tissierella praeacuta TaxID=43131 RepID=UPI00334048E2
MFKELTLYEEDIFNKTLFSSIEKNSNFRVGDFLSNQDGIYIVLETFKNFICVSDIFTERVYLYKSDKINEFEIIRFNSISDKRKYLNKINYNNKELYQQIIMV